MRSREHAELLLRKAAQDEFVVEKLSFDPASPDEVIGFHRAAVGGEDPEGRPDPVLDSLRAHPQHCRAYRPTG